MSRRRISDDERALWRGFARSVKPLRRSTGADIAPDQPAGPASPQSARQERADASVLPALAQFERRLRQRLARGQTTIDARLDLHGMTQSQAHAALVRFLAKAQAQGAKLVLVVTGKGAGTGISLGAARPAAFERGVLRRQVPLWLALPEFRRFVVSFEQAHGSHGGEGALYLRLRRSRH